ncbi:hypothetical protein ACIBG8_54315 [Nonomuraea sp. NPDC050556]|uniref:hypothetical protein n=1 Tax=Nonomuraea sp. NPDC050556 TaxID=3364369 RepID=UPI0037879355
MVSTEPLEGVLERQARRQKRADKRDELLARAVVVRSGDTLLLTMPFVPQEEADLEEMRRWVEGELDGVRVRFIAGVSSAVVQHADDAEVYPGDVLPVGEPTVIETGGGKHAGCGASGCSDGQS